MGADEHGFSTTDRVANLLFELFPNTRLIEVDRFETELERRRIAFKTKFKFLRRHEEEIGDDRMNVVPAPLPFRERGVLESAVFLPAICSGCQPNPSSP